MASTTRVLIVPPRFGEFAGGAEALLASYAQLLSRGGTDLEIATTCATDHHTWANDRPAGSTVESGFMVHRFPVSHPTRARGSVPVSRNVTEELRWFGDSMWCPGLSMFLRGEAKRFDAIIAGPYLFGTTIWSVLEHPERCLLVPCLHDEPEAHTSLVGQMLKSARLAAFNSEPELALARRLHGDDIDGVVIGIDMDTESEFEDEVLPDLPTNYVVYCGRMEQGKGAHLVIDAVQQHNTQHPEACIDLVMIGGGPLELPPDPRVHGFGFVSEAAKRTTLRRARALVSFSTMESLSIVALEAWREGTPVITGAECDVLRWQIERSGGGFVVAAGAHFSEAIFALSDEETRRRLGSNGSTLLRSDYSEQIVETKLRAALALVRGDAIRR